MRGASDFDRPGCILQTAIYTGGIVQFHACTSGSYWAFQPVAKTASAKRCRKADWAKNPIDAFILDKLTAGRRIAARIPKADRFDAAAAGHCRYERGLPPTQEEIQQFLEAIRVRMLGEQGCRPAAGFAGRYGERWGRPIWLDVARYADSNGFKAG